MIEGMEALVAKLIANGINHNQAESKAVCMTADILSNSNGEFVDLVEAKHELRRIKHECERIKEQYEEYKALFDSYKPKAKEHEDRINKKIEEHNEAVQEWLDREYKSITEYIAEFNLALTECESEEGRYALKAAQMFVNSVNVDTKYDNTAFIIGLASILSMGKTGAMDELRKMNKKIPKIDTMMYGKEGQYFISLDD